MNTPVGGTPPPPRRHAGADRARRPGSPAARPRRRSRSAGMPPPTTSASPATAATAIGTLISSGTGTSFIFTGLTCGTSYTLAVDAYDAAGNRSTRPSTTAATLACAGRHGPVAAYSFDAGSGTSLTDNSGNGNTGTISGATLDERRQVRRSAHVRRRQRSGHRRRQGLARPDDRNDARGLDPPDREQHLAHRRHQGDERQPDLRPVLELRCSAAELDRLDRRQPDSGHRPRHRRGRRCRAWTHLATTYDGAVLRLYVNGVQVATQERDRRDGQLGRPAPDRRQQRLGGVVPGPDRRPPRLQPRAHTEPSSRPT